MRLGIFGGSFDPVHVGHLTLAQACVEQAALDKVWFVPTAIQPLKKSGPRASDADRVAMIELAIDDSRKSKSCLAKLCASWRVCTLEIERGGVSYTVDTMSRLHTELPTARLFFMIGADAVRDVPHWKEPEKIFGWATPLVVRRAGESPPDLIALAQLCTAETQPRLVEMPLVDASSSEIRRRIAVGESIEGMVTASVAEYIRERGLY